MLLNGGAMLDVGVFGSLLMSSGSSLVALLLAIINGDETLLLAFTSFDERGDAAGTLCGVSPCA